MNTLVVFVTIVAVSTASVVPLTATSVIEGPSNVAEVIGPDGSAIISGAAAGRIVASESVGISALGLSAPIVTAPATSLLGRSVVVPATAIAAAPLAAVSPWGSVAIQAPAVW